MQTRRILVLGLVLGAVLETGCGDGEVNTAPTSADFTKEREALAARKEAPKPPANPGAKPAIQPKPPIGGGTSYAVGERDYFYDPTDRRDPFRSFQFDDEDKRDKKTLGPLVDFELGQLELSAVIWEASNPRALILDPGGRSYIVREGSQIGKNNGEVIHIGDNLVLVKETYENFAGERTTKDVELRIRLSQGG